MVEFNLAALVAGVFGTSTPTTDGGYSISQNFIAKTAVAGAETIRTKLKFVDATFGTIAKGTRFEAHWEQTKGDLNKRSRERNGVVHGKWSISDEYPDDLILTKTDGSDHRYSTSDLDGILNRITAMRIGTHEFLVDVLRAAENGELRNTHLGHWVTVDADLES